MSELSTQERFKRGAADAGRYFRFMADFIGFTDAHAETIRGTRLIIEKHIPRIVGEFYAQLLSFPATRKHFLKADGTLDQDYLELRMQHQVSFWRRTASGQYDEDYARFVDYVGRAHTALGADSKIYIPERYVLGMIGFVGGQVAAALAAELHDQDPDLETRSLAAWHALLMVLLELLSRPYGEGREPESYQPAEDITEEPVHDLALEITRRAWASRARSNLARSTSARSMRSLKGRARSAAGACPSACSAATDSGMRCRIAACIAVDRSVPANWRATR